MDRKKIKILYAEDDTMQAKLCIAFMEKAGYKVIHAEDGIKALAMYRNESPDVVLLDVVMPHMTGFDVAKMIRRDNLKVPILFISSLTGPHAVEGLRIGADDYIRKEALLEEVEMRIEKCLDKAGTQKIETDYIGISDNVSYNPITRYLTIDRTECQLTPLEAKIFNLLCENKNQYLTKAELLNLGWGEDAKEASPRYIDRIIGNLRKYIPKNCEISIATSWGSGYGLMVMKRRKKSKQEDKGQN